MGHFLGHFSLAKSKSDKQFVGTFLMPQDASIVNSMEIRNVTAIPRNAKRPDLWQGLADATSPGRLRLETLPLRDPIPSMSRLFSQHRKRTLAMKSPIQISVSAYRRITKRGAIQAVRKHCRKVVPHTRR
jgi:hypothetical protein